MTYSNITIYHNPRCSKSRAAYSFLQEQNIGFNIIEYQKEVPSKTDIKNILELLNLPIQNVIRTTDENFKQLNIYIEDLDHTEALEIISSNINLLQRPIIVLDNIAVIARPIENLTKLF